MSPFQNSLISKRFLIPILATSRVVFQTVCKDVTRPPANDRVGAVRVKSLSSASCLVLIVAFQNQSQSHQVLVQRRSSVYRRHSSLATRQWRSYLYLCQRSVYPWYRSKHVGQHSILTFTRSPNGSFFLSFAEWNGSLLQKTPSISNSFFAFLPSRIIPKNLIFVQNQFFCSRHGVVIRTGLQDMNNMMRCMSQMTSGNSQFFLYIIYTPF